MSKSGKKAISVFLICILALIILYSLVAMKFFTKDNKNESTISQVIPENLQEETSNSDKTEIKSEIEQPILEVPTQNVNLQEEQEITQEKRETTNVSTRSKQQIETPVKQETKQEVKKEVVKQENKQEVKQQPVKTTTLPSIGTIKIPKTNVNMKILSNVSVAGMETDSCFLYSTGTLNKDGNTVIVGHNYRNGKLFSNNNKLQIGDIINITTLDGTTVTYKIYSKFVTTPEDVSFYRRDTNNKPEITLSCCSDDEKTRIIILARP